MRAAYIKFILFIIFITFTGILLPVLVIEDFKMDQIMTVIIIILSSFRLSYIIINKNIKILELTFYIFVYVFLGLAPLIQIDNGIFPWGFNIYSSSEIFHANIIILLGLLGFEIGLKLAGKKNKFNKGTEISKSDFKSFFIYTANSVTVFIVVTALIGLENVFKPRNDAITATGLQSSSNLILNKLQEVPMYIGLVFGLFLWKYKDEKNKLTYLNLSIISILVFLLLFNLILNNPISSARFWVGTIYMSIIIIFIKWKPFTQSILVISIFSIFIFVFPYADLFRDSLDVNLEFVNFSTSFLSGDYDAFQQIMNSVKYTDIAEYSFGYQLLGVLFFWVPRSIWLDKPVGSGWTIGEILDYNFLNISAPLWSEFFINFGHIGVFLLFILYGYFISYLQMGYQYSIEYRRINFYSLFVPIFTGYQIFMLRGDLLSTYSYIFPIVIFIFLVLFLRKRI